MSHYPPAGAVAPLPRTVPQSAARAERRFGTISVVVAWQQGLYLPAFPGSAAAPVSVPVSMSEDDVTSLRTPSPLLAPHFRFFETDEDLGLTRWTCARVYLTPTGDSLLSLDELHVALPQLFGVAHAAVERYVGGPTPIYSLLHVDRIALATQRRMGRWPYWRSTKANQDVLSTPPALEPWMLALLLDEVEAARNAAGFLAPDSTAEASPPFGAHATFPTRAYFEHYSPLRRRRGYLVVGARGALALDTAFREVRILLALAEQAQLTAAGLAADGYAALQMRVGLWDTSTDVRATLEEQHAATVSANVVNRGQVMLSLALFGVGTLLALMQANLPTSGAEGLWPPIGLCVASALAFVAYILFQRPALHLIGFLLLLGAALWTVILFLNLSIPPLLL